MRHGFTSSQVATWQQQYNRTTLFSQQLMQESSNFKYDMVLNAESSLVIGETQVRFMLTAEIMTDAISYFLRCE